MKKGLNININIQKKHIWFLTGLIVLLAAVGFVYATESWQIHGHSANEIEASQDWQIFYEQDFESAVSGWNDNDIRTCGSSKILGGYGESTKCFSKTFTGLPTHTEIRVLADYFAGDTWDNEQAYAKLDNFVVWMTEAHYNWPIGSNICGQSYRETISALNLRKRHTASSIKVEFCANINSPGTDEWIGVDNLEILVK